MCLSRSTGCTAQQLHFRGPSRRRTNLVPGNWANETIFPLIELFEDSSRSGSFQSTTSPPSTPRNHLLCTSWLTKFTTVRSVSIWVSCEIYPMSWTIVLLSRAWTHRLWSAINTYWVNADWLCLLGTTYSCVANCTSFASSQSPSWIYMAK